MSKNGRATERRREQEGEAGGRVCEGGCGRNFHPHGRRDRRGVNALTSQVLARPSLGGEAKQAVRPAYLPPIHKK